MTPTQLSLPGIPTPPHQHPTRQRRQRPSPPRCRRHTELPGQQTITWPKPAQEHHCIRYWPLHTFATAVGLTDSQLRHEVAGANNGEWQKYHAQGGITYDQVDRWAIKLGRTPYEIYDQWGQIDDCDHPWLTNDDGGDW